MVKSPCRPHLDFLGSVNLTEATIRVTELAIQELLRALRVTSGGYIMPKCEVKVHRTFLRKEFDHSEWDVSMWSHYCTGRHSIGCRFLELHSTGAAL